METDNISEIINALMLIKKECTQHGICSDCPFIPATDAYKIY